MKAKARDHLIKHHNGTVLAAECLHPLKEAVNGLFRAHGFQKNRSNSSRFFEEQSPQAFDIVVIEAKRHRALDLGDAAIHRGRAHGPVVIGKERVLGALRDHVATGVGARQLERGGVSRGTVLGEFDHVRPLDELEEGFRALKFHRGGPIEVRAQVE
jgi:hypothetical protein